MLFLMAYPALKRLLFLIALGTEKWRQMKAAPFPRIIAREYKQIKHAQKQNNPISNLNWQRF